MQKNRKKFGGSVEVGKLGDVRMLMDSIFRVPYALDRTIRLDRDCRRAIFDADLHLAAFLVLRASCFLLLVL